jgi:hypothetical protein
MTVQPGFRATVQLAAWALPDDAPGGVEALEQPFPGARAGRFAGLTDFSRHRLCANCQHVGELHRDGRCAGITITRGGNVECVCQHFWLEAAPGNG